MRSPCGRATRPCPFAVLSICGVVDQSRTSPVRRSHDPRPRRRPSRRLCPACRRSCSKLRLEQAIRTRLGLHAEGHVRPRFDPKNARYPAITQHSLNRDCAQSTIGHADIEAEPDGKDPITARDLSAIIWNTTPAHLSTMLSPAGDVCKSEPGGRGADEDRSAPKPIKGRPPPAAS
jgi:hypothetical protein